MWLNQPGTTLLPSFSFSSSFSFQQQSRLRCPGNLHPLYNHQKDHLRLLYNFS